MIIDQNFKLFIVDTQKQYSYGESYVDENYNVVLIVNDLKVLINSSNEIKPYYEGYVKSKATRQTMINRAASRLVDLAIDFKKNCL